MPTLDEVLTILGIPMFRRSVLVVEDDETLKPLIAKVLHQIDPDLQVAWASSAEEALKALREETFDAVIADYCLEGGKNGLELWQDCREEFPEVHFGMISGHNPREIRVENGETHLPPFLAKPLRPSQCLDFFRRILSP